MTVIRENNEIIIRISDNLKNEEFLRLVEYVRNLKTTTKTKVSQKLIDKIADEADKSMWFQYKQHIETL